MKPFFLLRSVTSHEYMREEGTWRIWVSAVIHLSSHELMHNQSLLLHLMELQIWCRIITSLDSGKVKLAGHPCTTPTFHMWSRQWNTTLLVFTIPGADHVCGLLFFRDFGKLYRHLHFCVTSVENIKIHVTSHQLSMMVIVWQVCELLF